MKDYLQNKDKLHHELSLTYFPQNQYIELPPRKADMRKVT